MDASDQEQFESIEKQIAIETINISPVNLYKVDQPKKDKKSEEDIVWKFKTVAGSNNQEGRGSQKGNGNNITFYDDRSFIDDTEEDEDTDASKELYFAGFYSQYEEIYRKKYSFGTAWIANRQYFSSVFLNLQKLEGKPFDYYHNGCDPSQDRVNLQKNCTFDSEFESGNLYAVYRTGKHEYDLILQNDTNTKGNTQWFYFRINNPPKDTAIKLNIINFRKTDSLFNYGMMPCLYSVEDWRRNKRGWIRGGRQVRYFKNEHRIEYSKRYYYTLSFTCSTPHENDVLRVAQTYPYTNSDLNNYLNQQLKIKYKKEMMERETITQTIGRNSLDVITIKEPNAKIKEKPLVVILARQHPGETPASFVCEGMMDYFLSKEKESEYLRRNFEVKIIPMVNPDGVSAGNYRTNLYGYDLNRRWEATTRNNTHEAAVIKKYISKIAKGREIALILDLHGHSRKLYSFFYGNPNAASPVDVRMFPFLCSRMAPTWIKFEDSSFTSEDYKRNTARVQFNLAYKSLNIFTFETSFYGYIDKDKQKKHFTMEGYRQLGAVLGKSLYQYQRGKQDNSTNLQTKDAFFYARCFKDLSSNSKLIEMGDRQDVGSESCPEQCELKEQEERKLGQCEDYFKNDKNAIKPVKIIKKIFRKDKKIKEIYKSTRKMQVLDIAQVNSVFPNNIIALCPSSYLYKMKKTEITINASTQTEPYRDFLIEYEEEPSSIQTLPSRQINPMFLKSETDSKSFKSEKCPISNLLRSNIFNRPRTSAFNGVPMQSSCFISLSQRKNLQTKKRMNEYSNQHQTLIPRQTNRSFFNKLVQTDVTIHTGRQKASYSKIQHDCSLPDYSSLDTYLTNSRLRIRAKSIGKTATNNIFEHLKLRRRQNL